MAAREENEKNLSKIWALEAKLKADTELAKLYKADPEKFLADFELEPEEIAMVKSRATEELQGTESCSKTKVGLTVGTSEVPTAKSMCSCCTWLWHNCGKGCSPHPVGGNTVGD